MISRRAAEKFVFARVAGIFRLDGRRRPAIDGQ
jgi:hypothetical protein